MIKNVSFCHIKIILKIAIHKLPKPLLTSIVEAFLFLNNFISALYDEK